MVGLNLSKPKKQNSQSEQNHWNRHESSETKIATGFALLFPGVLLLLLLLLLLLCLFVCLFVFFCCKLRNVSYQEHSEFVRGFSLPCVCSVIDHILTSSVI